MQKLVSFLKDQIKIVTLQQFKEPLKIINANPQVQSVLETKWEERAFRAFIGDFQSNYLKAGKVPANQLISNCKELWMLEEADEIAFEILMRNIHRALSSVHLVPGPELIELYQALLECALSLAQSETEESFLLNQSFPKNSTNPTIDNGSELIKQFFEHRTTLIAKFFIPNLPIDRAIEGLLDRIHSQAPAEPSHWRRIRALQSQSFHLTQSLIEILGRDKWKEEEYHTKIMFFLLADAIISRIINFNSAINQFTILDINQSLIAIKVAYYPLFWAIDRFDELGAASIKPWDLHYSQLLEVGTLAFEVSKWNFWF